MRARSLAIRKTCALRQIAIVVSMLCALALATGLAEPAARALAAAADTTILLPALSRPLKTETPRFLFLVVAALGAVQVQGVLLVFPVPQVTWLDGACPLGSGSRSTSLNMAQTVEQPITAQEPKEVHYASVYGPVSCRHGPLGEC